MQLPRQSHPHCPHAMPQVEAKFEWDISKSVFGPRARTSESRSYFDHGTQAEKRAFEVDWRRINEKSRVQRLFVRESGGDEEAWKLVKKLLWKHFPLLYDVFDYYATIGDGDAFSIQVRWRSAMLCHVVPPLTCLMRWLLCVAVWHACGCVCGCVCERR